jgi:hypothetical protein
MVRRAVLLGGIVLLLLLLAVFVNSCRTSQHKNALKSYNRELSGIADESARTGGQFFQLLQQGSGDAENLQTQISSYRVQAEQQYKQARGLSMPDDMKGAQESALIALESRRDALDRIAQRVSAALGDQGDAADAAVTDMAGQMEVFLSSDVLWHTRVVPFVQAAFKQSEIGGQDIKDSRFLPSLDWLRPATVAGVLGQQLTNPSADSGQTARPGLHGTGLTSVTYGSTTLQPDAPNTLTYTPGTPFKVTFANQGDNDEFNGKVTVRIEPQSGKAIASSATVDKIAAKQSATVDVPLKSTPPLGTSLTIRVQVATVPGEKKKENNTATYPSLFQRG